MEKYMEQIKELAVEYAPKLALAIVVLVVGLAIIKRFTKLVGKGMEKRGTDATARNFFKSLINIGLKALLLISVASMVGIETTSFIAIIGAAGLAVGLALQGTLGNFASGVLLLLFRPYQVGDLVTIQGFTGHVKDLQIFNTILITPDNKKVIVPNSAVTSGPITNISGQGLVRIDLTFGVAYDADISKVREVVQSVADKNEQILKDPPIDIFVSGHGASSVDFAIRPWVAPANYWDVYFYLHEELKKAFDANGIGIPYTTYDVNIVSQNVDASK